MLMFITVASLVLAVAMTIVAWRLARLEHRRSQARVAALAAEIHADPVADLPIFRAESVAPRLPPTADAVAVGPTFGATATAGRPRVAAAIAAGVFVVGSAAALAVVLSGPPSAGRVASGTAVSTTAAPAPVELVALGHERDGDALGVHGTVRNPRNASEIDGLSAVVFLYHRDGSVATSTRAAVVPAALVPGGEASFRVVVPNAGDVARYRVSFRTDNRIVAHVDRRGAAQE